MVMRTSVFYRSFFGVLAGVALPLVAMSSGHAQSISEALALAYRNNPTINTARAELRAVDEGVPQALSGWRPQIFGNFDVGGVYTNNNPGSDNYNNTARLGLSVQQALFRGFRTVNSTRQAEAIVRSQRESLRATEQNILFDAAASYMDVIRDTAIVSLRRSNISFLQEQVRAAQDRFEVGEGTRTDVSQAQARLADAQASLNLALANVNTSRARFRQIIGEDPKSLSASTNIYRLLPKSVEAAMSIGAQEHPAIQSALHVVDAAIFNVKTIEGELLPTVTLEGNVARDWYPPNSNQTSSDSATIFGRVSVPIYQAGRVTSQVRQAKEELGQAQVQVDVARDQIRASIVSAWGQYQAAVASISAAQAAVEANQLALEGVIEEQRVGQRTTLDVLDAQLELVNSRVQLVTSQRDRVVAAYLLVSTIGRLGAERLGVPAQIYQPQEHFQEVRNSWFGTRTPDGR
ncbi:TolC family outer membrane protein [Hongsoonwoonella zoysiae]|uniref:TolC family outer membrane protein n=1 Tax=Hongsoonwoonella zoysiae TaxID=2821844 RepID=UPI001FE3769F|nr:TolC family outer membrane protein [Hongsoonwoonella zoysiae]